MLWKSSEKVGFGYSGGFVVARYCASKAEPIAKFPKPPKKNILAFALNVCPMNGCDDCPKGLGFNSCFNDRSLEVTNYLRKEIG